MTLLYTGNGKHITGIPARDLETNDISRIAGDYGMPETELIELLITRGIYSRPPQVKSKVTKKLDEPAASAATENEVNE